MRTTPAFNLLARVLLVGAGVALAGCEPTTTGSIGPRAAAVRPEPPMTHARAAMECWMQIEKDRVANLDRRADIATKCIGDKLAAAQAAGGRAGLEANAQQPRRSGRPR